MIPARTASWRSGQAAMSFARSGGRSFSAAGAVVCAESGMASCRKSSPVLSLGEVVGGFLNRRSEVRVLSGVVKWGHTGPAVNVDSRQDDRRRQARPSQRSDNRPSCSHDWAPGPHRTVYWPSISPSLPSSPPEAARRSPPGRCGPSDRRARSAPPSGPARRRSRCRAAPAASCVRRPRPHRRVP